MGDADARISFDLHVVHNSAAAAPESREQARASFEAHVAGGLENVDVRRYASGGRSRVEIKFELSMSG